MNSGLQCMSNVPELTKYFLSECHVKEYNKTNSLGMKGRLAQAYGNLMKTMWNGRENSTRADEFKRIVGSRVRRFSGYSQQDAAELVNYLLDLIHEDLNRVKSKPLIKISDD